MDVNTEIVTLSGLLVAAVGILIGYWTWRKTHTRDESRLDISSGFKADSGAGSALVVTLRNKGRYPAFVEAIDLCLKSDQKLPYKDRDGLGLKQPIKVTDEKPEECLFALSFYMPQIKTLSVIKRIEVRDTTGKTYKFPAHWFWSQYKFSKQMKQQWTTELKEYWMSRLESQ